MTPEARKTERLIAEVTADVLSSETIDEALEAISLDLRTDYSLWRTSVWMFVSADAARLQALWAIGDSEFETGMQVKFSLTSDVEFLATSVLAGKPMMFRTSERDLGLLTDMLRREGIAAAVVVPIRRARAEPVGLLVLASSDRNAFRSKDVRLFTAIARAVGGKLVSLMTSAAENDV